MTAGKGVLYVVSAIACAGQLFGLFYLLQGKGIKYLYVYCGCYLVNGVLQLILQSDKSVSFIIGFILGLVINIGLTYLASKDTFKDFISHRILICFYFFFFHFITSIN